MKKISKMISLLMALVVCSTLIPASMAASSTQPALWFMDAVKITQVPGGDYSHSGTQNFDVVGHNGNSNIKAPFDCKVVAIYTSWNCGNTVVIESLNPVQYADGTVDYMSMAFAHDNDISNLKRGQVIKQGEVFYQTGNYGQVTGVHSHVTCIRGKYQFDMWKSANGKTSPNEIAPTKALFVTSSTQIVQTKGLSFTVWNSAQNSCKHTTHKGGYCVACGRVYPLTLTPCTPTTYQVTKTSNGGAAIWARPYSVSTTRLGTMATGSYVTVVASTVNKANKSGETGNLWYLTSEGRWIFSGNVTTCSTPSSMRWVYGTDGSLCINSKPKAGYAIAEIPEGGCVTVNASKSKGNWLWVTYNGISGYSYSKYLVTNPSKLNVSYSY